MHLPVESYKEEILAKLGASRVLVIAGETGSGKSTKIPQMIYEAMENENVIVTQPRRVAATSLAHRVGMEMAGRCKACKNGGCRLVGYTIRFEDTCTAHTRISYVTDGILLKHFATDIKAYTTVVLDEVHDRTVRTDILLGLMKLRIAASSPEDSGLKLILMSATLDAEAIIRYFRKDGISVDMVAVPGACHPVEIRHLPYRCADYIQTALETIRKIHSSSAKRSRGEKEGSQGTCTLVFLSGIEDIDELYDKLAGASGIEVLRMHSSLTDEEQRRIFAGRKKPRVILSTNIAETSLTIPGVSYVVDTGVMKTSVSHGGIERLGIVAISKSSAKQRAGRAGRLGPGVCYRLYTEEAFLGMEDFSPSEILRSDLSSVSLSLLSLGASPLQFDFFLRPPEALIQESLRELLLLGMIDKEERMTPLGTNANNLPLTPSLSKFVLLCKEAGIGDAGCSITAMLTAGDTPFTRAKEEEGDGNGDGDYPRELGAQREDYPSDLMMLASLFQKARHAQNRQDKKEICKELGIKHKHFLRAEKIYLQLTSLLSTDTDPSTGLANDEHLARKLHAAGSSAFVTKIARIEGKGGSYVHHYTGNKVHVHPASSMFSKRAKHIVFMVAAQTSKLYVQHVFPYTPY